MANSWRQCSLGDVIELKRGYDLPTADRRAGSIPIISSSGPSGWHDEAMAKPPGVVTGRYGTIGQVFFIEQDFWPLNTTLYVRDFKGNDERFVSYFLRSLDFQSFNDKSSVPGLNRNDLHRAAVRFPSVEEQKEIARVLGSLDDKIEQNRRTGRKLEALARAVFKAWFVDFEPVKAKAAGATAFPGMPPETFAALPNTFQDSPLGPVPQGWEAGTIKERTSVIQYGLTTSATTEPIGPRFLRITDIRGGAVNWNTVPYCAATAVDSRKYRILDGDIVVARTGASTGDNLYVVEPPEAIFASYLVRFQFAERAVARMVAEFMRTDTYQSFVKGTIGGSAQPNANAQMLASAPMVFPPLEVAKVFFEFVHVFDLKKAADARESAKLVALRDYLLPRLLSGRVRVENSQPTVARENIVLPLPIDTATPSRKENDEFKEAILIAALVRSLAQPSFPLGRKRYNKIAYFVHRKAEHDVRQRYLKKAAGPYSPWAKYQGPERIAVSNGYVKRAKVGNFAGLLPGDKIAKIDAYLPRYDFASTIEWVVGKFRFRKNDDLELFATVDFAAIDLRERGERVDAENVHNLIASESEWAPKLDRVIFSNSNIARALYELQTLFPGDYTG